MPSWLTRLFRSLSAPSRKQPHTHQAKPMFEPLEERDRSSQIAGREGSHVTRSCSSRPALIVPPIGKLVISGACRADSACEWMAELIAGLQPFELRLRDLIRELPQRDGQPSAKLPAICTRQQRW